MVLDLFELSRERFSARTITTGATASNVLGLGMQTSQTFYLLRPLTTESLIPANGREFAVRHAMGDNEYSVAEDGFGGVIVKVLADQPHASMLKAASLTGIGRSNVRVVSSSLSPGQWQQLIAASRLD